MRARGRPAGRSALGAVGLASIAVAVPVGPAHGACVPGPTHRVGGHVLIGRGPVQAGSAFGRRAVLAVGRDRRDGRLVGKLYWLIRRRGPAQVRVAALGLDGQGAGVVRAATGRAEGAALVLDRELVARADGRPGDGWVGAAGELRLPAPGCYRLRAEWPGGAWVVEIRARVSGPPGEAFPAH